MKTRQRKEKASVVPKSQNDRKGCVKPKKSEERSGGQHHRATGLLPSAPSLLLGQQFSNKGESFPETTKDISFMEIKTGQLHSSAKIKLQLFPIDESTRTRLEKVSHNPFLELTLSARKRISSVIKHLNAKWAGSSVARGELILFPYNTNLKNQATQRWTEHDTGVSAGHVHSATGSPLVFRLRYGWISIQSNGSQLASAPLKDCLVSEVIQKTYDSVSEVIDKQTKELKRTNEEPRMPINVSDSADAASTDHMPLNVPVCSEDNEVKIDNDPTQSIVALQWNDNLTNLSIGGLLSEASLQGKTRNWDLKPENKSGLQPIQLDSDISIGGLLAEASLQGKINNSELTSYKNNLDMQQTTEKGVEQSKFVWDDSLTNLSVGGLLSEASLQGKINSTLPISDSFDAFIAAQMNFHPQASKSSLPESLSSILDAEETCHAFPSQKLPSSRKDAASLSGTANSVVLGGGMTSNAVTNSQTSEESKVNILPSSSEAYSEESNLGLTNIKWSDSLGPFDLGMTNSLRASNEDSIGLNEFVK